MIKNYYYLIVGTLTVLFAFTHALNGQTAVLPLLNVDVIDLTTKTMFFYVWNIITVENLLFGIAFLLMAFCKDLAKVRFTAWMIGVIMVGRWLVISGSTLIKNKANLSDIVIDSIAIWIVVVLIILGTKVNNNVSA